VDSYIATGGSHDIREYQGILYYWNIYSRYALLLELEHFFAIYALLLEHLFKVYFTTGAFIQSILYNWSIYSRYTLLLEHL